MISITLPTVNENRAMQSLESIRKSSYQDFEVIVDNVFGKQEITDTVREFGFKQIVSNGGILQSRYLCGIESKGEKILLLSDTRTISPSLLKLLEESNSDIIIIRESEMGKNLLSKIQNMESTYFKNIDSKSLSPLTNRFILPRGYSASLFRVAMEHIKNDLPANIFRNLGALDQEIIYYESYSINQNIGLIKDALIFHCSDENLYSLLRKHYKYGKHTAAVRETKYARMADLGGRLFVMTEEGEEFRNFLVLFIRGIPFLLGYLISTKSWNKK